MGELLEKVKAHREAILLGEIGALLHMFGKCSSEFLIANSQENQALPQTQRVRDSHQDLKRLPNLKPFLESQQLTDAFTFTLGGQSLVLTGNFTDFITKYKGSSPDSVLLSLFNTCHRMTSADEKGVVRRPQSRDNMWITTPFGYGVGKLDLNAVDAVRTAMDSELSKALDAYLKGDQDVDGLHDRAVQILKEGMSQALGETRQPANDVTLWAQSHGVASLYKPVLATLALGLDPCPRRDDGKLDYNNVRWRLLGIGWNGVRFVQRGRRPGDILRRQDILEDITAKLQRLLEVQYPLGNLFYRDLNGLFFTFPGLEAEEEKAEALVRELAPEIVEIVRGQSDTELWPFFTLSKPRRTLTAITREISERNKLASLPRVAALLSLERDGNQREEKLVVQGPSLSPPAAGQDICPVCQFRSKQQREDACQVCQERRSGRQDAWQGVRQGQTIWIDEVADRNNRVALLTLRFDLSRWLNGEWLTTLWSQTLDEWSQGRRLVSSPGKVVSRLRELVNRNEITVSQGDLYGSACTLAKWVLNNPTRTECKAVLEAFLEEGGGTYEVDEIPALLQEIEDIHGVRDTQAVLKFFFTQNPSPARLRRIWEATESFLGSLIQAIESETFATKPQRLRFTVTAPLSWAEARQTYRITVRDLKPATLTVLCIGTGQHPSFSTVSSLEHFEFANGKGPSAVQAALEMGGISEWRNEETGQRIAGARSVPGQHIQGFNSEGYLPFIVLARSPAFCQLLLPAESTPKVLRELLDLEDKNFGKVQGKLPLHVSLLVANRRFPLYALLEAGQMALDHESCSKGALQAPWWNGVEAHAQDSFFGHYPTTKPSGDRGWALTDLAAVDKARQFWMTPGYFEFDFLGYTADRHNLSYEEQDGRTVRPSIAYGTLHPRPFTLHRLRDLMQLWDILTRSLGSTQRHHLKEALTTKLEGWEAVDWNEVRPVFETFGKVLLQRAFGEEKWAAKLTQNERSLLERSLSDGLLLEALELFQHVVKEGRPMDEPRKYLAWCLDPMHIGTGGYRLGRVDMSIVREPSTGIPKIPGTSLAGAIRAYAEMVWKEDKSLPDPKVVFGNIEGDGGVQGMLRFYDGDIVFFPVSSHLGTVWISTLDRLKKWLTSTNAGETIKLPATDVDENKVLVLKGLDGGKPVHMGWLLLETEPANGTETLQLPPWLSFIKRLVAVSDKLFHHLVNDHLEVRTSVQIEDDTGAAKERALFTYEAIPRGTVVGFEVALDTRRGGGISSEDVQKILKKAFAALKVLGVGGMGTRGFGRIEILNGGSAP